MFRANSFTWYSHFCAIVLLGIAAPLHAQNVQFPPELAGGKSVVTDTSDEFLSARRPIEATVTTPGRSSGSRGSSASRAAWFFSSVRAARASRCAWSSAVRSPERSLRLRFSARFLSREPI